MAHDPRFAFMALPDVEAAQPEVVAQGVSAVARGPGGFLDAYRQSLGDPDALSPAWVRKRDGFVARHLAQARGNAEPRFDRLGWPTRRHLALITWAYTPTPKSTDAWLDFLEEQ